MLGDKQSLDEIKDRLSTLEVVINELLGVNMSIKAKLDDEEIKEVAQITTEIRQ